jgi:ATP-dependent RNA helicase RhlE
MGQEAISFLDFKFNKQIWSALEEMGFDKPTPIQAKSIPLAMAGHDVMGIAQTGTGKTAAYSLPLIMKVKYATGKDPRGIIIVPTRELASQIDEAIRQFAKYTDLRIVALVGGASIKLQREQLEQGSDIIIATPGRFMELYFESRFELKFVKTLVLDEADKLMDMGFMPQLRKLLEILPVKRQNMLFSATMSEKTIELSNEFLEYPEVVEIAPQATVIDTISQEGYLVPNLMTKINLLDYFLRKSQFEKVLIFTKTKTSANDLYKFIGRKITDSVRVIHGNKDQNTRLNAINDFRASEVKIMVATDVVARGIDIREIDLVINFDVPLIYEDYVHRVGRTGRHFKAGRAITFINPAEVYHIGKIEKIINSKLPMLDLPAEIPKLPTPKEEKQVIDKEIDYQKRAENPDFKGAFHEKKERPKPKPTRTREKKPFKYKRKR